MSEKYFHVTRYCWNDRENREAGHVAERAFTLAWNLREMHPRAWIYVSGHHLSFKRRVAALKDAGLPVKIPRI